MRAALVEADRRTIGHFVRRHYERSGPAALFGGLLLSLWGGFRRRIITLLLALILDGASMIVLGLSPASAVLLAAGAWLSVGLMY